MKTTREPERPQSANHDAACARVRTLMGKGVSFSTFAASLGMHPATLRRYMVHEPPGLAFFMALHRQGYSVDWLLSGFRQKRLEDHPLPLRDISTRSLLLELARREEEARAQLVSIMARVDALQGGAAPPASAGVPADAPDSVLRFDGVDMGTEPAQNTAGPKVHRHQHFG